MLISVPVGLEQNSRLVLRKASAFYVNVVCLDISVSSAPMSLG